MKSRFAGACGASALLLALLAACGGDNDNHDAGNDPVTPPPVVVTPPEATPARIGLSLLGRYTSADNGFAVSAAEIPAFDAASKRGFVVNAQKGKIDVLDLSDPASPRYIGELDATAVLAQSEVNSVAVRDGVVALAVQAPVKTDPGLVAFYRADNLSLISSVAVGALPDMLIFTPDGKTVLVANEAEPSDDYQIDPEGSIGIVDVRDLSKPTVRFAGFRAWNGKEQELRQKGVRIYGPNASAAQDLEPEYIAVSADGTTAWATLQENNALAKIDIASATVTDLLPLGYKDHGLLENALDTNDEDGTINIRNFPGLRGLYLPDAIKSYTAAGNTYLVLANEGDARAWGEDNAAYWQGDASKGFVEEFRVKHLVHTSGFARRQGDDLPPQLAQLAAGALLNPATFGWCGAAAGSPGTCRDDNVLGRLNITWTMGYRQNADGTPVKFNKSGVQDNAGDRLMYDNLYSYGARSFSIRDANGKLVFDSADQFERMLASDSCMLGPQRNIPCKDFFNSGHDEGNAKDSRSDAKGPEPEGVEIGTIGSKTFAFIGLERMGGVMVYDITDPKAPVFQDYLNTRTDWTTEDTESVAATAGDLGPEGLAFVPAAQSPNGKPMLIVGNEVSGTTVIFGIDQTF